MTVHDLIVQMRMKNDVKTNYLTAKYVRNLYIINLHDVIVQMLKL
jgi:hypothetical protein